MAANEGVGGTAWLVPRMDCVYVEDGENSVNLQVGPVFSWRRFHCALAKLSVTSKERTRACVFHWNAATQFLVQCCKM